MEEKDTGLSLDNILGAEDLDFILDSSNEETPEEKTEDVDFKGEEIDTEGDPQESVGNEENNKETEEFMQEDPSSEEANSTDFFSSIALALKEEGVFPDIESSELEKITSAEDFVCIVNQQINNRLSEQQKRVNSALDYGVEPSEIKKYEQVLQYLDSIASDSLTAETDDGERLRSELIYHDFINRGYSQERAQKEVKKSINAGTDIEDAVEALKSNKEFFTKAYDGLISEAKEKTANQKKEEEKAMENLKHSIMEDETFMQGFSITKDVREKIFKTIAVPSHKDPSTGAHYTELQKYQKDNPTEFLKNIGIMYVMTDGFKNLNKVMGPSVNKEVRKGMKELEKKLKNASYSRPSGGLSVMSGVSSGKQSTKWSIDL